MAVNHADGTALIGGLACPLAAGLAAISAEAGWLTCGCLLVSLPAGVMVFLLIRVLGYGALRLGMRLGSLTTWPWLQSLLCVPFFLAYLLLPMVVVGAGFIGTWWVTIWFIRAVL
ncbi:MAG: hypothetical protein CMJ75_17070 [Planctomycetaceae bacterium]|nr:hypothetical protein [Planctomycetaceae bacterium]